MLVALQDRADLRFDHVGQVEVGQAGRLLHGLDHGEVRDALAVWKAATLENRGPLAETGNELLHQAGLPHACRPKDREELAGLVTLGRLERLPELAELAFAAHHRRVQMAWDTRNHLAHAEEPPGP